MSANGVNEDPRRESVWVAHNNMKLLNFFSSFIALLLIGFSEAKPGGLVYYCSMRPSASGFAGSCCNTEHKSFLLFKYLKNISKYASWSIDHLIECYLRCKSANSFLFPSEMSVFIGLEGFVGLQNYRKPFLIC